VFLIAGVSIRKHVIRAEKTGEVEEIQDVEEVEETEWETVALWAYCSPNCNSRRINPRLL